MNKTELKKAKAALRPSGQRLLAAAKNLAKAQKAFEREKARHERVMEKINIAGARAVHNERFADMLKARGKSRILKFADYIESLGHLKSDLDGHYPVKDHTDKHFCMSDFYMAKSERSGPEGERNICRTPSCIAGHAAFIADPTIFATTCQNDEGDVIDGPVGISMNDLLKKAKSFLGIDGEDANLLFTPAQVFSFSNYRIKTYLRLTPKESANALRRFANGEREPEKVWADSVTPRRGGASL